MRGAVLALCVLAFACAALRPPPEPDEKPKEKLPPYEAPEENGGDKKRGARVFERACSTCHGDHGQGGMSGIVGAINEPAFLSLISDQALRRIVITGRPDLGMPNYKEMEGRGPDFAALTSQQINDLVAHLAYWRIGGPAGADSPNRLGITGICDAGPPGNPGAAQALLRLRCGASVGRASTFKSGSSAASHGSTRKPASSSATNDIAKCTGYHPR